MKEICSGRLKEAFPWETVVEEVIVLAGAEGRRLVIRKTLVGICLGKASSRISLLYHIQGFSIISAQGKDEGSGVRYLASRRCLKLNLREDFGERDKIES